MVLANNVYAAGRMTTVIICLVTLAVLFAWMFWSGRRRRPAKIIKLNSRPTVQAPAWKLVEAPPAPPPVFDQEDPATWPQNLVR